MKKIWALVCSIILGSALSVQAIDPSSLDELDKNGLLLALPLGKDSKEANLIRKFQEKEGTTLLNGDIKELNKRNKREQITVEKLRNGEVLVVTIPASMLFMPNDIDLRQNAARVLMPFKRYLKNPDMYWVILDMHSDNTGNSQYNDNLTLERVTTIFDWFEQQGCNTQYLFPTASGQWDPLPGVDYLSLNNRAKNRRLEIYLVPGEKMLQEAKRGRIAF